MAFKSMFIEIDVYLTMLLPESKSAKYKELSLYRVCNENGEFRSSNTDFFKGTLFENFIKF